MEFSVPSGIGSESISPLSVGVQSWARGALVIKIVISGQAVRTNTGSGSITGSDPILTIIIFFYFFFLVVIFNTVLVF